MTADCRWKQTEPTRLGSITAPVAAHRIDFDDPKFSISISSGADTSGPVRQAVPDLDEGPSFKVNVTQGMTLYGAILLPRGHQTRSRFAIRLQNCS